MKLAICNDTYDGWPLERACEHAAACGFDAIELAPFTLRRPPEELTLQDAHRAHDVIRSFGLEVVGFHYLLLNTNDLHLTRPDADTAWRTLAYVRHLIDLTATLGGRFLIWGSPAQRTLEPTWNPDDAWKHARDLLRAASETAAEHGITIALEPLAPTVTNFLTTAEEAIHMIESVDHEACRLHLDVLAMSSEARSIPAIITSSREHLVHVHANDPNLGGPGSGDVDYTPIIQALRAIDYAGYLSIEVFRYDPSPETIAERGIAYLRSFL